MKERGNDKQTKGKQYGFFTVLLAFFVISFLGWAHETLLMLVLYGKWYDRGFLFLPFCPIYGFPVCSLFLLFGAPHRGRFSEWLNKALRKTNRVCKEILRYFFYFLLSGGYATFIELLVGLALEGVGISLWSYSSEPYNFHGHICLQVSLFWGLALTVLMRFAFLPLLRLLGKIPKRITVALGILLSVLLSVDFFYNAVRYFLGR